MSREEQVEKLTAYMANFIGYTAKVLPDDVIAKLDELAEREDGFLPAQIQNFCFFWLFVEEPSQMVRHIKIDGFFKILASLPFIIVYRVHSSSP